MTAEGAGSVDESSIEMLRSYECPDGCEFFDSDDGTPFLTEREAFEMLGGDEHGFVRCIDCGEELEPTIDATLDMLKMVAERHPEMAAGIAAKVEEVLGVDG